MSQRDKGSVAGHNSNNNAAVDCYSYMKKKLKILCQRNESHGQRNRHIIEGDRCRSTEGVEKREGKNLY